MGFTYRFDSEQNEFIHPSGLVILTPQGKVSRYLYGIKFASKDLYYGLIEASEHKIGKPIQDRLALLFCYSYDPAKGTYQFNVINVVRLGGVLTMLLLGTTLIWMWRSDARKQQKIKV